jgi:hypothetical protein
MVTLSGGHFLTSSHCKLLANTEGAVLVRRVDHTRIPSEPGQGRCGAVSTVLVFTMDSAV